MKRYSQRSLPAYRYTPGLNPHPTIDEGGHSYGHEEDDIVFDVNNWASSEDFLYGIDLLNHGYFWESHEVFEGIWKHLGKYSDDAQCIQGIILVAVASLHARRGKQAACEKVVAKALSKLQGRSGVVFGCQMEQLIAYLQELSQDLKREPIYIALVQ